MAFLGSSEIKNLQHSSPIFEPFLENRIKNGAYELSLGTEVYLTDSKTGKVEILDEKGNRCIDINPGQFALLLTKEKVHIPDNKIAFISIKAGEKLKGLVNVSGFHVDPGFHDHLLFSVYNAGPSVISLAFGEPYFPIWLAELKEDPQCRDSYNSSNSHFGKLSHIPVKYIEALKKDDLTSPAALNEKIKNVVDDLTKKIDKSDEKKDRNEWLWKIMIGLLIGFFLKMSWDFGSYHLGFKNGQTASFNQLQKEQRRIPVNIDAIVSQKVDSILAKRVKDEKTNR